MENNIEAELYISQIEKPNSNFKNIDIDFGKIEGIDKDAETQLNQLFYSNEYEINKYMASIFDINQLYFVPKYFSKILENKIKKIFNFHGFFLYFKREQKLKKKNESHQTLENLITVEKKEEEKKEEIKNKENEDKNIENQKVAQFGKSYVKKDEESNKSEINISISSCDINVSDYSKQEISLDFNEKINQTDFLKRRILPEFK